LRDTGSASSSRNSVDTIVGPWLEARREVQPSVPVAAGFVARGRRTGARRGVSSESQARIQGSGTHCWVHTSQ